MMSLIGNQPVMWVNVTSLLASGPYSENNMLLSNRALIQACASYPNMRVPDWGRGRQGQLVHLRRHSLHLRRLRGARLPDCRALAAGFPDRGLAAKTGHTDPAGEDPPNCLVR